MPILKSNITNYLVLSSAKAKPKNLVIILHGYGADAHNLLFMAHFWKRSLDDCLFIIPDAPESMQETGGFKWFEVGDLSAHYLNKGVEHTTPNIQIFVSKIQNAYGIAAEHTVIGGFSQGAMLALSSGLLYQKLCAGILAYSGGLYLGKHLPANTPASVCLIHGARDTVVPKDASESAYAYLSPSFDTSLHILPDLEHAIDLRGLQLGEAFIKNTLK